MDAIIGRYKVRMGDSGLILTHPSGISFEITADEALELQDFLKVYHRALITSERETNPELERIVSERETNPELERIVIEEHEI